MARRRCPANSDRYATVPPTYPGSTAIWFVTFAASVGTPTATSAGNEMSEPPPATAFTAPAANAAAASNASSPALMPSTGWRRRYWCLPPRLDPLFVVGGRRLVGVVRLPNRAEDERQDDCDDRFRATAQIAVYALMSTPKIVTSQVGVKLCDAAIHVPATMPASQPTSSARRSNQRPNRPSITDGSVWMIHTPPSSCRLIASFCGRNSTNASAPAFMNSDAQRATRVCSWSSASLWTYSRQMLRVNRFAEAIDITAAGTSAPIAIAANAKPSNQDGKYFRNRSGTANVAADGLMPAAIVM